MNEMTPKELSDILRVEAAAYLAAVRRIADQLEAMYADPDEQAQQDVPYPMMGFYSVPPLVGPDGQAQREADAARFKSD